MTNEQPTFDLYIEPLLSLLAEHPSGLDTSSVYEILAARMNLSPAQRSELLPSGRQTVCQNRIGWANDRLKRAGLSYSLKRGTWALTARGEAAAKYYVEGFPSDIHQAIARPQSYAFPQELLELDATEYDGGEAEAETRSEERRVGKDGRHRCAPQY